MKRINIDVSKGELDYIREALEHKHTSLMSYLDTCEEHTAMASITEQDVEAELEMFRKRVAKPKKAPWGYKKDGTPKKRPGPQAGF